MNLLAKIRQLAKVELHAHLNGSLSEAALEALKKRRQELFPNEETRKEIVVLFNERHVLAQKYLNATACLPRFPTYGFDEDFAAFAAIHKLTDHPDLIALAAEHVVREFAADNVVYLELRSTPRAVEGKMSKRQYVEVSSSIDSYSIVYHMVLY